jgi:hypothetical protein
MKLRSLGIAALLFTAQAIALGGREASANVIYDLSGVTFSNGGTATGTFTTNDAITALLTYDITTSMVGGFPGFEYTPTTAPDVTNGLPTGFSLSDSSSTHNLVLAFSGGLTATGATLLTSGSFETNSFSGLVLFRGVVSGSVVGVPEPSSLLLGGVAAGVLTVVAYAGRKRRRARG